MNPKTSRRQFVATSLLAGTTLGLSSSLWPLHAHSTPADINGRSDDHPSLRVRPRYHRWHVDPGVDWLEINTRYAMLDWTIPLPQAALVLVDVWQRHYIKDAEARAEAIISEKLVPLLAACRKAGMAVIHAPSPGVAKSHPNWVRLVSESEMERKLDDWPPPQFRNKGGTYEAYRRPHEPRAAERRNLPSLRIHPKVQPLAKEPVVATGEELHRYCKQHGVLFLLFAGFNTNCCIILRDYGTIQMSQRGYEVVLIRDCTTGMESRETQPTLSQTRNAILQLEMFGQYSVASDEIVAGLRRA